MLNNVTHPTGHSQIFGSSYICVCVYSKNPDMMCDNVCQNSPKATVDIFAIHFDSGAFDFQADSQLFRLEDT